jgi:hypothetical protein
LYFIDQVLLAVSGTPTTPTSTPNTVLGFVPFKMKGELFNLPLKYDIRKIVTFRVTAGYDVVMTV